MRRQRRLKAEMNVVPYIDVMLVLLIIFMVAAPLINPGTIDLPSVGAKLNPAVAPLEVQVSKDGLKLIDRNRGGTTSAVTKATLVQAVQAAVGTNAEQAVVIAGDKDVRYEEVLIAMDALQRAGVKKVGLLAKPAAR